MTKPNLATELVTSLMEEVTAMRAVVEAAKAIEEVFSPWKHPYPATEDAELEHLLDDLMDALKAIKK